MEKHIFWFSCRFHCE